MFDVFKDELFTTPIDGPVKVLFRLILAEQLCIIGLQNCIYIKRLDISVVSHWYWAGAVSSVSFQILTVHGSVRIACVTCIWVCLLFRRARRSLNKSKNFHSLVFLYYSDTENLYTYHLRPNNQDNFFVRRASMMMHSSIKRGEIVSSLKGMNLFRLRLKH